MFDDPDIINILVKVEFVLILHVAATEFTTQEVEPENEPEAITFSDVNIVKEDPIEVEKLGFTTN